MSINRIMDTSKGALAANQLGIATTSHNISNANTEGYSRQRVDFHANTPVTVGKNQVGTGVLVGAISRSASKFLNVRMAEENSKLGRAEGVADLVSQVESLVSDESETGLSSKVTQFYNDLRSLSTQPESAPLRAAVRESASAMASRFSTMRKSVVDISRDVNERLSGSVENVNGMLAQVAELNKRISSIEVIKGAFANDERDQRDLLVRNLAKEIPLQISEDDHGSVTLASGKAGVLVSLGDHYPLKLVKAEDKSGNPSFQIFTSNQFGKPQSDITKNIDGGKMGGLIHVRDNFLTNVVDRIDTLAFGVTNSVNDAHSKAFTQNGKTGIDFFEIKEGLAPADGIQLSKALSTDLGNMATGKIAFAPGDNRGILDIVATQDKRIFDEGNSTVGDFMTGTIGTIGVETKANNDVLAVQSGIVDQLATLRDAESGVSLDEEAIDMLRFQKAFDANAKMVQVADSMMETVLNLKRF
jgi:flagellar hook-associated protein 1 FlgK